MKPVEQEHAFEQRPATATAYRLALCIASTFLLLLLGMLLVEPARAQTPRTTDQAAIELTQTVGTSVGICSSTNAVAVTSGSVYFCVTLLNSGTVPLSQHRLTLGTKTITFTQALNPGQQIQLTSNILSSFGKDGNTLVQTVSGTAGTVLTSTVIMTSTNAQADVVATGQATARVVIGRAELAVTKTVGLTDACSTTKGIAVDTNATVKYCVTIRNTGTLTLTNHRLVDPQLNVDVSFPLKFPVGATLVITDGALQKYDSSQHLNLVVTNDVTNTATVTSTTVEGASVSASAKAVAAVGKTSSAITYTVGLEDGCATSTQMPFISNRTLYYCLKLTNNGTMPLEAHTVRWQSSLTTALVNTTITQTVQPGQSLIITHSRISQFAQANVSANATNVFTVTSTNHRGMVITSVARGAVTVGAQTLLVTKYATTDKNGCVASSPLTITSDQEFYYCVVITNTGQVPLVRHAFVEGSPINISGVFSYTLAPGQKMTLTNQFLDSVGLSTRLGPFKTSSSYFGTFNVSATSANNIQVYQSAATQINVSVPTVTSTPVPTAIPTFTPSLTPIQSPSPTFTPTPTPTPVVLSFQATPTQPFSVNAITTPTPGVIPGAVPPAVDQFGQPIPPTIDPFAQQISPLPTVDVASTVFALTVEAAATQTAFALIPPPVVDTPIAPPIVQTPLDTPLPTFTVETTPTPTLVPLILTPLPSPEADLGYLAVISQVFQVSTATLGWLWFVVGSLIFFVTAGMFAGLGLRYRGRQGVYEMDERATTPDEDMRLEPSTNQSFSIQSPTASSPKPATPEDDDYWPASLR